jgi:hypothetical protein
VRATGWLAALVVATSGAFAQDADVIPPVRHILAIDFARIRPLQRSYDMTVSSGDSVVFIGTRSISMAEFVIGDSASGWMLTESRTGVVSSVDSLLLAPDLRPLRWRSVLGAASLDLAFSSDSVNGSVRIGSSVNHASAEIPPDAILSTAALELIASLLPLDSAWTDSVHAMVVDLRGVRLYAAELAVAGTDSVTVSADAAPRPCWIVTLKSEGNESRLWVDRETTGILRTQHSVPSDVGAVVEYRLRLPATTAP